MFCWRSVIPGVWAEKKWARPTSQHAHGTEKLVASIARSATRPACFRPQADDFVQDRLGNGVLGVDRHLGLAPGGNQGDRVAIALETDLGIGDVVEHDQVGPLALELATGALGRLPPVLGREADDRLTLLS